MRELKRLRNERGWSQQRLADESSVNKATINQVEQGKRSPTIETLEKLADALDVEVADFFPKAQIPLPLPDFAEQRQGAGEGQEEGDGPHYTPYEALGHLLASSWTDELKEWDEKIPPGEYPDLANFGQLMEWVMSIAGTRSLYEAIAKDAGYTRRKECRDTLQLMEEAYRAALQMFGRVFEPAKTDSEFQKIVKANELDTILGNVRERGTG